MATDYVMPKLAMGMNEGTIVDWLVSEGQRVERGAPLMQVETEKVVYDVEAPVAGCGTKQRQHQARPLTIRISAATALASSIAGR